MTEEISKKYQKNCRKVLTNVGMYDNIVVE